MAANPLSIKKSYAVGDQVAGRYRLKSKLGEGGMGAVWSAYDETLEVDVALKLIRAEEVDSPEGGVHLGDRMLQEARAAARLGHPAIARVFDFGTTDQGDPFIVMELLKGEDLADTLARRGQIAATKAVATLLPIVHALETAHAKGIVHRDIKPENIYLARAEDGRVQPKLVDFGVAKIERAKNHRLTQTGAMLGSPVYMSPEQARGDDVDRQADVWALCVVLYEMIAGRPPFEGKNYNALLYAILSDEPIAITHYGLGDEELWDIVKQGLCKAPEQRWSSMQQLGTQLARWLLGRGVQEDITGASVTAQWLRRVQVGADALASMMPPADETFPPQRDTPTQRFVVNVTSERTPRVSTGTNKTMQPRNRRAVLARTRAARVAGGSAALGVVLVGLVAWFVLRGGASAPSSTDPAALSAPQGAALAVAEIPAEPADVQAAPAAEQQPPPQQTAASASAEQASVNEVAAPAPAASAPLARAAKPKAASTAQKRWRKPAKKKPALKNPFE